MTTWNKVKIFSIAIGLTVIAIGVLGAVAMLGAALSIVLTTVIIIAILYIIKLERDSISARDTKPPS